MQGYIARRDRIHKSDLGNLLLWEDDKLFAKRKLDDNQLE